MAIINILKRKDASSLVVGIVLAGIISGLLTMSLIQPAARLSGAGDLGQGIAGWKAQYLQPVVFALLQLVALELLTRVFIAVHAFFKKK